jgi:site-specific DNA-cytosine methylase
VESASRVGNIPRALLVSSVDCTARANHEPATTVVCVGDGHSVSPRALLVDGKGNRSVEVTTCDSDTPAFGVPASSAKHRICAAVPSGRVVRMTPRALARFQSVPDWYVLPNEEPLRSVLIEKGLLKPKSNGMQLSCLGIGNGVPCEFMAAMLPSVATTPDAAGAALDPSRPRSAEDSPT